MRYPHPPDPQRGDSESRRAARGSSSDLGTYGYYGQGYPIYGRPTLDVDDTRASHSGDGESDWFSAAGSAAYAFGYTSSMHPAEARPIARHRGKGPKGYVRPDARIREDVCERLSEDREIDASDVSVYVTNGEVQLQGTVIDRSMKRKAEIVALSVRGALDVHNELRVKKSPLPRARL
jgi:osmotically-inducible protein OsmY